MNRYTRSAVMLAGFLSLLPYSHAQKPNPSDAKSCSQPPMKGDAHTVDVVFDIDQTIATQIHPGSQGDYVGSDLGNPSDPRGTAVTGISAWDDDGKLLRNDDSYRVYANVGKVLQALRDNPKVRVSFFSGGYVARNEQLLKAIHLPDGTSAYDMAFRICGTGDLTAVQAKFPANARYPDRFKKDLAKISDNLPNVLMADDSNHFLPPDQRQSLLWIQDSFPYPERVKNPPAPKSAMLTAERTKFDWIYDRLKSAIDQVKPGTSAQAALQKTLRTGPDPGQVQIADYKKDGQLQQSPLSYQDLYGSDESDVFAKGSQELAQDLQKGRNAQAVSGFTDMAPPCPAESGNCQAAPNQPLPVSAPDTSGSNTERLGQ